MKIGVLINDITCSGGTERITSTLTDVFSRNGHSVSIISCFKSNDQTAFNFNPEVEIYYLNEKANGGSKFKRIVDYFRLVKSVRSIVKSNRFDLILCQSFPMTVIGYLASRGLKTRVIACEHTSYEYYSPLIRRLSTFLYQRCSKLVVINKTDLRKYQRFCKNVEYIPNIVEISCRPVIHSAGSPHRIVSAGRLEFHKGFDRLVSAMRKVKEVHPEVTLEIYGDGSEKENLQGQIEALGLSSNVFLRGNSNSLDKIFEDKTIYVLPSRIEGFGLVLVEAAYFGLPLISFDCPNGPRDILADNKGLLIADGNIEGLASAIISLVESETLWGEYHQKSLIIKTIYGSENIYGLWDSLFKSLE